MKLGRVTAGLWLALVFFALAPATHASDQLVLKTDFQIWTVNFGNLDIFSDYQKRYFKGMEIAVPDNQSSVIEPYLEQKAARGIDLVKLQEYLENKVAPDIARDREDVMIREESDGKISFEGHGLYGRRLDVKKAALLVKTALEDKDLDFVNLPLIKDMPHVTVMSDDLKEKGIVELVSSGETDFRNSPANRIVNINVGLSKFQGHLVKPGEEFVFGQVLGPVEGYTGFKKELVIKGDRTLPEYGGGLCQVSTTAYRAALAAGFPVTQRTNHSYAVSYYLPIGLDATVYPPSVDMKWVNDSPGHILMQTFTIGHKAYYNYYGTKDKRKVYMIGPYYSGRTGAPPARYEYTPKLAPGEKKVLGHAVPGVTANWFRQVVYEDPKKEPYFERIFSKYQARPDFFQVGSASASTDSGSTEAGPASLD